MKQFCIILKPIFLVFLVSLFAVACTEDGYDGLREKADVEAQEAQAQANRSLESRAQRMEADLTRRQRFYQTVAGQYEGVYSVDNSPASIRITLIPTVFPLDSGRTRLPEEVASDLNDLALDVHIVQWSHRFPDTAWGCRAENVKSDLENGRINILVQDECTFTFSLGVVDPGAEMGDLSIRQQVEKIFRSLSRDLTQAVLAGRSEHIDEVAGVIRPTLKSTQFYFRAQRVGEIQ